MSGSDPKSFEAEFEEADRIRCEGGEGRFNQGRFPYDRAERTGMSGSPYTVFVGFSGVFTNFAEWLENNAETHFHGSVFARTRVGNADHAENFFGNLPADPKIRNRNPKIYLANLLWSSRDQHQSLTYDFRDNSRILTSLAHDAKAKVIMVRNSWLLDLLNRSSSFENTLANARRLHKLESRFLREFEKDAAMAQLDVIELNEVMTNPAQSLRSAVSHISKSNSMPLSMLPECVNAEGLDNLARKLRNNGLNVEYESVTRTKDKKIQETVFEKPYVVK